MTLDFKRVFSFDKDGDSVNIAKFLHYKNVFTDKQYEVCMV